MVCFTEVALLPMVTWVLMFVDVAISVYTIIALWLEKSHSRIVSVKRCKRSPMGRYIMLLVDPIAGRTGRWKFRRPGGPPFL